MTTTATFNDVLVQPEVEICKRIVDLFILVDCSTSMEGAKIAATNQAMRECSNELKDVAGQHPEIEHRMRCISFASKAQWHIGPDPVEISKLTWKDLTTSGYTETGAAVNMLADAVKPDKMPGRGRPPVMVLISDGGNTDGNAYDRAVEQLNQEPWGAKAVRLSIGIGTDYDHRQLEKFTNHPEVGVLEARNTVDLAQYIKYATVTAPIASITSLSAPERMNNNLLLPAAPKPVSDTDNINLQVF